MSTLRLPAFEVPRLPRSKIPPDFYWEWVMQGILRLHRAGRLNAQLSRPDRCPVDVRFRLK